MLEDKFFIWSPLVRRHLFWPPSMVYISVIITHLFYRLMNFKCGYSSRGGIIIDHILRVIKNSKYFQWRLVSASSSSIIISDFFVIVIVIVIINIFVIIYFKLIFGSLCLNISWSMLEIMCNRLKVLNDKIDLDWLNLSLTSFKLKMKEIFLSNDWWLWQNSDSCGNKFSKM